MNSCIKVHRLKTCALLFAFLYSILTTRAQSPPTITTQPANETVLLGFTATLTIATAGIGPLYYQWQFNGTPIANATNTAYSIASAQFSNSGSYSVVVSNSAGSRTSLNAILTVSQLIGWGAGTTNNGIGLNYGQSAIPLGLSNAVSIASGGFHSLALLPEGNVTAWGYNFAGVTNVPSSLTNAAALAAGLYHSSVLRSNGTVTAWGMNANGQTSVPATATNVASIAAGWYHNLALRSNGTVLAWGAGTTQSVSPNFSQSIVPANLTGVMAVAAGGYHSLALLTNGTVAAWGWNASGQTNIPAGLSNVVAIAAGGSNSIALKRDGTLVAWGDNTYGQANIPAGLSNVVAISAGAAHVMALKNDGTLVIWGLNDNGQTSIPSGLANVTAISAGGYHSLAMINFGPVTFLNQPYAQTIFKGGQTSFTPTFLGATPVSFQWLKNGTNVPNATGSSLIISNALLSDAGMYQLVGSNSYGAVTSAPASLTVNDTAPFFLVQPTNQWVLQNSNATLTASVGGIPPFGYQWQLNGVIIAGATTLSITVSNAQPANEGNYSLIASNAFGITASSNAFLNVVDVPEALGPTNLVWLNIGQPAWFVESTNTHDGFAAAAVGPLSFQNQVSLQTAVVGPGTISFWWADFQEMSLSFEVDGISQATWQQYFNLWSSFTFYIPSGNHALTWTAGNGNSPSYSGMAFLDQVTFTPGATPVAITTQPANLSKAAGNNVTFNFGTVGTPPFSYQWYFNNTAIPGATSSSLTLPNIQSANVGNYYVAVTNGYGFVVSSNASLTVTPSSPVFTSQPGNVHALVGGQATLGGVAIGSNPINYQWLFNNSPISGATNPSLTIGNVQYANGGNYVLVASNALGATLSTNAVLLAYSVPDLAATLNCPAINWSTTNVPWFPETNITYDGISAAQSGAITNTQQSTLQGIVTGPATITYYWKVSCDSFWDSLAFSINGTIQNSITGTVDWQQASNYIGAGSQTLQWSLYPVHGSFAGGTGWVDQVQVIPGGTSPVITANPPSTTNSAGNKVSFSVTATGTPPLLYQWQLGATKLSGATNSTLTLNSIQSSDAGQYSVTITNNFGSASSSNATLVVNSSAPVVTTPPVSQARPINSSVTFTVAAKGTAPLTYQWQYNGGLIPGATTTALTLTGLAPSNDGNYSVIVTNTSGVVTSSIAVLDVESNVVVDLWPLASGGYSAPVGLGNILAVAAGTAHTVALREDSTVVAWGDNTYGQTNVPAGLSNVTAIVAGAYHSAALKSDGTVIAWGDNTYGEQIIPTGLSNVTALAAATAYTLALKGDGTVVGWGNNTAPFNVPLGLTNVQAIAVGIYNVFAVKNDGSVAEWGYTAGLQQNGTNIQLSGTSSMSNVTTFASGAYTAWTLQNDDTVWNWNLYGSVLNSPGSAVTIAGSGNNGLAAGDYCLMLKNDSTLTYASGFNPPFTPLIPAGIINVVAISAGAGHAVALMNDGTPRVALQLLNRTIYSGSTTIFSAGIIGSVPLNFKWQYNGTDIPGATNAMLVLTNVPLSAAGSYGCIAANNLGAATNLSVTLTVLRSTPQFNNRAASLSNNGFALQLDYLSGHGPVIIQASTNLVDWTPIFTNPPVTGSLQYLDSNAINQPRRFYRAIEQ